MKALTIIVLLLAVALVTAQGTGALAGLLSALLALVQSLVAALLNAIIAGLQGPPQAYQCQNLIILNDTSGNELKRICLVAPDPDTFDVQRQLCLDAQMRLIEMNSPTVLSSFRTYLKSISTPTNNQFYINAIQNNSTLKYETVDPTVIITYPAVTTTTGGHCLTYRHSAAEAVFYLSPLCTDKYPAYCELIPPM